MKCILTKLATVVQQNNLNRLGHLVVKINNTIPGTVTPNYAGFSFYAENGTTLTLVGAHFQSKSGENVGKSYVKGAGESPKSIVVEQESVVLDIAEKYDLIGLAADGYLKTFFGTNAEYVPVDTSSIKYCTKLKELGVFPLAGKLEDLTLLTECEGTAAISQHSSSELSGDVSVLPAKWFGLGSKKTNRGTLTYTKGRRHGSQHRAICLVGFKGNFSQQDYENYLVAMATNAWDPTVKRGTATYILYDNTINPTRKIKEALWYLTKKMYMNVGDKTRTEGNYFKLEGIDISDITQDPGWD